MNIKYPMNNEAKFEVHTKVEKFGSQLLKVLWNLIYLITLKFIDFNVPKTVKICNLKKHISCVYLYKS